MTRRELAEIVAELRAAGATNIAIADALGISRQYASDCYHDPDGAKARMRKQSYAGACLDCGAPTDGSNGRANASARCQACWSIHQHEGRVWTQETIIDALGPTPMLCEDAFRIVPNATILREFGSWAECRRQLGWPQAYRGRGVRGGRRCGTASGYTSGCRCDACRAAIRDYQQQRKGAIA